MPYHLSCLAIELVQSTAIPYPESSTPIFPYVRYAVAADACGVSLIMDVPGGLAGGGVQAVKSFARCQPQYSGEILGDHCSRCVDPIMSKGFSDGVKLIEKSFTANP